MALLTEPLPTAPPRAGSAWPDEAMTTGRRYGDTAALAVVVAAALPEAEVLPAVQQRARDLAGKDRGVLDAIKAQSYATAAVALTT